MSTQSVLQMVIQLVQLVLSPNQQHVRGLRQRLVVDLGAFRIGWLNHCFLSLDDIQVKLPCSFLGLGTQLTLQCFGTPLILLERGGAPSLPRVQLHERAMYILLQRVQRKKPDRGLDGSLHVAGGGLLPQEITDGLECKLAQTLSFGSEPFVKSSLIDAESFQQLTPIEQRCLLERCNASLGHQLLETRNVDLD